MGLTLQRRRRNCFFVRTYRCRRLRGLSNASSVTAPSDDAAAGLVGSEDIDSLIPEPNASSLQGASADEELTHAAEIQSGALNSSRHVNLTLQRRRRNCFFVRTYRCRRLRG